MKVERDDHHRYYIDGQPADGVTTVLKVINKPSLNRWREEQGTRQADEVARQTADHGTLVHSLVAMYIEDVPYIPLADEEEIVSRPQLEAFRHWWETHVEEVLLVNEKPAVELFVAHPRYRYAGALDILLRMVGDKVPTLIDLKTTSALYPEMRYQTAAYREAFLATYGKEMGIRTCRRGVLWLPRVDDAKCEFKPHDDKSDFQGFLSALYLYRDLKRGP